MDDRTDERADETGSVADEAMKLMESLGLWVAGAQASGAQASSGPAGGDAAGDPEADDSASGRADTPGCSCTGDAAAAAQIHQPAVCKVCPVCRVGSLLEGLSPEVMERFADLIAMVAGSLQAVAQQRRSQGEAADAPPAPAAKPAHKVRVTGDAPEPGDAVRRDGSAE